MATIRQISEELGVPKARVAKWVRDHFDTASLSTLKTRGSSGAYDLSDEQTREVKQHFISVYSERHQNAPAGATASGSGSNAVTEPVSEPDATALLIEALKDQIDDLKAERREMHLQMDKLNELLRERSDEVRARDAEIKELRSRLDLPWWKKLLDR